MSSSAGVAVVGVGADGVPGLSAAARAELAAAEVLFGGGRQLELMPPEATPRAERIAWPSPLLPALDGLFEANAGRRICVLASGDPLLSGIGSTLV
ncbi:MAG: SAM-dependent methyltransferase, partial [Thermocrispum sp.]